MNPVLHHDVCSLKNNFHLAGLADQDMAHELAYSLCLLCDDYGQEALLCEEASRTFLKKVVLLKDLESDTVFLIIAIARSMLGHSLLSVSRPIASSTLHCLGELFKEEFPPTPPI